MKKYKKAIGLSALISTLAITGFLFTTNVNAQETGHMGWCRDTYNHMTSTYQTNDQTARQQPAASKVSTYACRKDHDHTQADCYAADASHHSTASHHGQNRHHH